MGNCLEPCMEFRKLACEGPFKKADCAELLKVQAQPAFFATKEAGEPPFILYPLSYSTLDMPQGHPVVFCGHLVALHAARGGVE